jgi:phosphate uptake regulator
MVDHRGEGSMETRKVQVTGGSTYTVSLPKTWATENGVSAGSVIEFYPEEDALLLTPKSEGERLEGTMDVSNLDGETLTRAVMTMYVSGFDVISLEAGRIDTGQRRAIREAVQGLVGVEVLEETSDSVVIQDLLDSSELSIENAVTRMRLIAQSMLEDATRALIEDDDDLAQDVKERDDDVDRLWYAVARIFRTTLRSPLAAEELGIPREDCFDYHASARQLERIADHASKIAQRAQELDEIPDDVAEGLQNLHDDGARVVEEAMDALFTDDSEEATELANAARQDIEGIDDRTREVDDLLRELDPHQAQALGLVVDSLSRSADYGGNIAENALQKAAPSP